MTLIAPENPPFVPEVVKQKSAWRFGITTAVILLAVSGAAYGYFGVFTQSPAYLWKAGLYTTREGLKAIASKKTESKKGVKIDGTITLVKQLAVTATVSGATYEQMSNVKLATAIGGAKLSLEVRTLPAGSTAPDVYVYPSGFATFAPLLANNTNLAALVGSLDGKWLSADHTTIEQLGKKVGFTSLPSSETDGKILDVQDTAKKVATVINNRLLSDDESKGVLVLKESLAKEDFKGRKSQHLRVQIRKSQMHDFAIELKDTLKDSSLKEWLIGADSSQSFEQAIGFESLLKRVDNADYDKATADVWVDVGYKTIRNIRFYDDPKDTRSYTELFFDYKGGDEYPLALNVVAANTGGTQNLSIGFILNRKSDKITTVFSGSATDTKGNKGAEVSGTISFSPTNDRLQVKRPDGAIDVGPLFANVLGQVKGASTLKVTNPNNASFLDTDLQ